MLKHDKSKKLLSQESVMFMNKVPIDIKNIEDQKAKMQYFLGHMCVVWVSFGAVAQFQDDSLCSAIKFYTILYKLCYL